MQQPLIFPAEIESLRARAMNVLIELEPAVAPKSDIEVQGLMLSSRTNGGRALPPYYLVYFLLVDLLGFPNLGQWEKTAWAVPIRYRGRLYGIEHRKMGLGIFAPTLVLNATRSQTPDQQAEEDALAITALIKQAVLIAEPYYQWRAEQAVSSAALNVINKSSILFDRYEYFLKRFRALSDEAMSKKGERIIEKTTLPDGTTVTSGTFPAFELRREAEWNGHSTIEAFFSWTEHAFIHLAILQGKLPSGSDVARIAEADWKSKYKAAFDLLDPQSKMHYDKLLDLRAQVRNFVAHGAFGKRGEAFRFHSGAGAVPVLLTNDQLHKFSLTGLPAFDERLAIEEIESFLDHMWSGTRAAARHYIFSGLPTILSYVVDGTYARLMHSEVEMKSFIEHLNAMFDRSADMDW